MSDLKSRVISGLIYALLIFICSTFNPIYLLGLMIFFCFLCLLEFFKITKLKSLIYKIIVAVLSIIIFFYYSKDFIYSVHNYNHYLFHFNSISFIPPVLFLMSFFTIFKSTRELTEPFAKATISLTYIVIPFILALTIPSFRYYLGDKVMNWEIFFIFLLIWVSDSFAYLIGSLIGRHKIVPTISKGKTWEGFIAGILFTIVAGFIIHYFFNINLHGNWIIISIIVALTAPIGDLTESKIKRFFNVKDSGSLIPGHGGFLDRLDSFIFVIPFIYLYYLLYYTL